MVGLGVLVRFFELVVQESNVLLDRVDELRLVLGDRTYVTTSANFSGRKRVEGGLTSNLGSNEESIELGEDAEHLIRIPRAPKSIAQPRDDLVLNPRDALVVRCFRRHPNLRPIYLNSSAIDSLTI